MRSPRGIASSRLHGTTTQPESTPWLYARTAPVVSERGQSSQARVKPISVARPLLIFGVVGGLLAVLLRGVEYRFLVIEHSVEIYGALLATVFVSLGIWLGLTLTKKPETVVVKEFVGEPSTPFQRNAAEISRLGLTPRELQILELIASGLSNKEIAALIFVSENTVKTHSSRLFEKLQAKRRTQAVQIGKDLGILP